MHHPLSLRFLANITITILLTSNLVSAFHVRDLLHTLRSLKDAPAASIALNARNSSFVAPATISNGTAGSSHPDSTTGKEGGLGLSGLLHHILGRDDKLNTSTSFKVRTLNITTLAPVGSNDTTPAGSSHPDAASERGHGLGLSGLFHKIFHRHDTPITIPTLNLRAANGTVTPPGVSNGTTPSGSSHPNAAPQGGHGLGLSGLFHKIFSRQSPTITTAHFNARNLNGTVLPPAIRPNGTTPTGSSHPDSATEKGQGLGLSGFLNKILGRSNSAPLPVKPIAPEDVDEVDGDVGMLMSLNRRVKRDGEAKLSREERRKNREKRRVRRAMSAAAKAEKAERNAARSRVFRG
ncbi:hypothetical protein SMACR_05702 [Sordaria macrospora]|uniref:WGS project CABT00000000 data, contig 2.30 n=2 Tax=Sordaria macrospora TaxID=5147 RepID=F7W5F6_SORMK|nr:uncharacterized protein SMAC_05702 [Sordaria macrospora k-hell]KAA8632521.1 hypothetical protein SMACR_05702 [Sordaria macrospora]WPJ65491.1 hypothetical protein SMAC4_05702 [Sordaria macrospora]CCC12744.1 unnamed protein product [Sordaria macrospora k-hell]